MINITLDNIKFVGKNKKYIKSRTTGRLILSPEYRAFVQEMVYKFISAKNKHKYKTLKKSISVMISMYTKKFDIDAIASSVLDAMQKAEIIDNDLNIYTLLVHKCEYSENHLTVRAWEDKG